MGKMRTKIWCVFVLIESALAGTYTPYSDDSCTMPRPGQDGLSMTLVSKTSTTVCLNFAKAGQPAMYARQVFTCDGNNAKNYTQNALCTDSQCTSCTGGSCVVAFPGGFPASNGQCVAATFASPSGADDGWRSLKLEGVDARYYGVCSSPTTSWNVSITTTVTTGAPTQTSGADGRHSPPVAIACKTVLTVAFVTMWAMLHVQ
jgi:hypothetical protein